MGVEAKDGLEGLEHFGDGVFDLVITDFDVPGMRGDKMLDRIWELRPDQKAMVVSSRHERFGPHLKRLKSYLSKPFLIQELRAAVENSLWESGPVES